MKDLVFLAQSDTTVGFFSHNQKLLNKIKQRPKEQKILLEVLNLSILKRCVRAPNFAKNKIRRAKKTTFVYQNANKKIRLIGSSITLPACAALRVNSNPAHANFLKNYGLFFATSANKTKSSFDLDFALNACDVLVLDQRGLKSNLSSRILKLSKSNIKKLR